MSLSYANALPGQAPCLNARRCLIGIDLTQHTSFTVKGGLFVLHTDLNWITNFIWGIADDVLCHRNVITKEEEA